MWLERDRLVEIAERLFVPRQPLQDEPDIVGNLGMLGRKFERDRAIGQGFGEPLQAKLADSFQVKRAGLSGIDLQ